MIPANASDDAWQQLESILTALAESNIDTDNADNTVDDQNNGAE